MKQITITLDKDENGNPTIHREFKGMNKFEVLGVLFDTMHIVQHSKDPKPKTNPKANKTPMEEWLKKHHYSDNGTMSVRLYNVLKKDSPYSYQYFEFVEDVTRTKFLKARNAGQKTWEEFVELRGY